jgi:hypothetical protein
MGDPDWRVRGQDKYLFGATLVWKPYEAWSETWEHDHCEFCWAKFVEPGRRATQNDSDVLPAGFAAQHTGPDRQDDYHWICESCAADLCARFEWSLVREEPR